MARVAATASLGVKKGLGGKKGFTQYDSISPHHSFTIERSFSDDLSDEELAQKADELHKIAETKVLDRINAELKKVQEMD